jgi:hypothetical protein
MGSGCEQGSKLAALYVVRLTLASGTVASIANYRAAVRLLPALLPCAAHLPRISSAQDVQCVWTFARGG